MTGVGGTVSYDAATRTATFIPVTLSVSMVYLPWERPRIRQDCARAHDSCRLSGGRRSNRCTRWRLRPWSRFPRSWSSPSPHSARRGCRRRRWNYSSTPGWQNPLPSCRGWFGARWYLANVISEVVTTGDTPNIDLARMATRWGPADPFTHWRLGVVAQTEFTATSIQETVRDFAFAVQLSPNDFRYWDEYGRALEMSGDQAAAEVPLPDAIDEHSRRQRMVVAQNILPDLQRSLVQGFGFFINALG